MATAKTPAAKKPAGPPPTDDFVYTAPNGGEIVLPPMAKALSAAELRKLRKAPQLEIVYYVVERDNPENPEIFDEALDSMSLTEDIPELIKQWQDFSRTSLGESSAS